MTQRKQKKSKAASVRVLSIEENRACLAALDKYIEEKHGGSENSAARSIGITQQVLNRARKSGQVGRGLAELLVKELGTTIERLTAEARDPWPNRMLAVPLAQEHGVDANAILSVLSDRYDGTADVSRVAWVLRMAARANALKPN